MFSQQVKLFVALAPVVTVGYTKGLLRWLVPIAPEVRVSALLNERNTRGIHVIALGFLKKH